MNINKNKLLLVIFISLTSLLFIFDNYSFINDYIIYEGLNYLEVISLISTCLIYLVPILLVSYLITRTYHDKFLIVMLSFLGGAYLIGTLASELNYLLNILLESTLGFPSYFSLIESSIVPPLVEEVLKLIVSLSICYIFKIDKLRMVILVGLASGIGFQFTEDVTYILNSLVEGEVTGLHQALMRLDGAFSTHFVWTSITTSGFYLLTKLKDKKNGLIFLFLPLLIHAIWNSPLVFSNGDYFILSIISWYLFAKLIRYEEYEIQEA